MIKESGGIKYATFTSFGAIGDFLCIKGGG